MRKLTWIFLLLSLLFLFLPSYVKADTMVITGGSLTITGSGGNPSFSFSGQNFSLSGAGSGGISTPCNPCTPNSGAATFSLSKGMGGDQVHIGSGTINGTQYPKLFYEGSFEFTAGTVKIPNLVLPEVVLTTPFTMTGSLCARSETSTTGSGCRPDQPDFVFSNALRGQGLATVRLRLTGFSPNGVPEYQFQSLTYNFSTTTPQLITFTDDFNDNARDAAKWSVGAIEEPVTSFDLLPDIAERNQRLEISPRSNKMFKNYGGYVSSALWNLTGGSAMVEVLQTASGADTIFTIGIDSGNWYRFIVEDGFLYFQRKKDDFKFYEGNVRYNSAEHRFWRFRHDYVLDQMVLETSGDGLNWSTMRAMPRDISLEAMRVEMIAGTFVPVVNPGTAVFDNFKLETFNNAPSTSTTVGFSAAEYLVSESISATVTVNRIGDTQTAFSVDYSTSNAAAAASTPCQLSSPFSVHASEQCDYATTAGTLRFAPGEVTKTIQIPIIDDGYREQAERFIISLRNPQGANLNYIRTATIIISDNDAAPATVNPIDLQDFFIRQQYIDFLGRIPEPAGFQFWQGRMNNCPTGDICDRIDTSQRFFQSNEFQERGFYVYRLYDAVLGRLPLYKEFMPDVGRLSGPQTLSEQRQSKDDYLQDFTNRSEFKSLYGQYLTPEGFYAADPAGFINALCAKAGITPASKQSLIDNLASGQRTLPRTLEDFILTPEMSNVGTKFYDRGFITMQYFGYLRRDPDTVGFNFWVGQLIGQNAPHRRDYRFMVGGFLQADEYRFRFAPASAAP
ncbi:MAG TPA: DUF4214 domain-containing protein [Pyrinomonadaceae bacterium]|jgi:hypothetical protein